MAWKVFDTWWIWITLLVLTLSTPLLTMLEFMMGASETIYLLILLLALILLVTSIVLLFVRKSLVYLLIIIVAILAIPGVLYFSVLDVEADTWDKCSLAVNDIICEQWVLAVDDEVVLGIRNVINYEVTIHEFTMNSKDNIFTDSTREFNSCTTINETVLQPGKSQAISFPGCKVIGSDQHEKIKVELVLVYSVGGERRTVPGELITRVQT